MALTRIQSIGIATGISLTGVTTTQDAKIGTGITLSPDGDGYYTGIVTATSYRGDVSQCTGVGQTNFIDAETINVSGITSVGAGITLSPDGDVFATGVCTATSFSGDGSALTGIDATQIATLNTSVQTTDTGSNGTVKVTTDGTEALRVDNSQNVLIGDEAGQIGKLSVFNAGSNISAIRHSGNVAGPEIGLNKFRGSRSSPSTVADGDNLGNISWYGYDGTTSEKGAQIDAILNGTVNGSNMTTDLKFSTTTGNTLTERLRITSDGHVSIPVDSKRFLAGAGNDVRMYHDGSDSYFDSITGNLYLYNHNAGNLLFGTGGATKMSIDSSGRVDIGVPAAVTQTRNVNIGSDSEANLAIETHNDATSESSNIRFFKSGNTGASPQVVETDDVIARLQAYGYDGTDYNNQACGIDFAVDGAPGSNDMPGKIVFKTNDNTTSPAERMRITASGELGLGTNDPDARLHVQSVAANDSHTSILATGNGNDRWTFGVGTGPDGASSDGHRCIRSGLYFDTGFVAGTTYTRGGSATTGYLSHWTDQAERMRIDSTGHVVISRSGTVGALNSNDAALHVNAPTDGGQGGIYIHCNSQSAGTAAAHYGLKIDAVNCANNANPQCGAIINVVQQYTASETGIKLSVEGSYSTTTGYSAEVTKNLAAVTNAYAYYSSLTTTNSGGTAYHFRGDDDGSVVIYIHENGNVQNANNSYGSTSDLKLKENIVDASSQWNDIKNVKVRKFNFKTKPSETFIGVVAQEIETTSPGLVHTENDIEVDDATGEGTITGTTKSVKYSILYMKAIKALQEAMARIETLESKVATLESS